MPKLIAVTHPGKIGDMLWALPTAKALAEKHGCQVDFYTSEFCEPARQLVEAQPYINIFIVPLDYVVRGTDCGVQPWEMPVRREYEKIYQLGFRSIPNGCIGEHIADTAGLPREIGTRMSFENLPPPPWAYPDYVALAARGNTSYRALFEDFARRCPKPCICVGSPGEDVLNAINGTCRSMLDMAGIIAKASAFVGLMSSPLVIANSFSMPKIAVHDGIHWDLNHALKSPSNHYPVNPSVADLLKLIR